MVIFSKYKCPKCGRNHKWKKIYTSNGTILEKIEKTYISWCKERGNYVLLNL